MIRRSMVSMAAIGAALGGPAVGAAFAAEPIKVTIGGYYAAYVVLSDIDNFDGNKWRTDSFKQEQEIHFKGQTKLDNGLTVGFRVELEGYTDGDQIDEHYVFFRGDFGEIRFGAEDGATDLLHNFIPTAAYRMGVDDATFWNFPRPSNYAFSSSFIPTFSAKVSSDSNKIIYLSPSMGGFKFGLSYSPDRHNANGSSDAFGALPKDIAGLRQHMIEPGIAYAGKFGDFAVSADVGLGFANVQKHNDLNARKNQWRWGAALQLGYQGFTLAGAYVQDNEGHEANAADGNTTERMWGLGAFYETGPWQFSVNAMQATDQDGPGNGTDRFRMVELGTSYGLGPGIRLNGGVQWGRFDGQKSEGEKTVDGWAAFFGTSLVF